MLCLRVGSNIDTPTLLIKSWVYMGNPGVLVKKKNSLNLIQMILEEWKFEVLKNIWEIFLLPIK